MYQENYSRTDSSARTIYSLDVLVSFDAAAPVMNVAYGQNAQRESIAFEITSDEQDAFVLMEGNRLSADDVSRRILEPLLFPEPLPALRLWVQVVLVVYPGVALVGRGRLGLIGRRLIHGER